MLTINGVPLANSFTFPGGEHQIKIPILNNLDNKLTVETKLESANDIMELVLVKEALDSYYSRYQTKLVIHYFPYARQDRRCADGESFSGKAFVRMLNELHFDIIVTADLHSEKLCQYVESCMHVLTQSSILDVYPHVYKDIDYLVAPDKGSIEKIMELAGKLKLPYVIADKIRDPITGNIYSVEVYTRGNDIKGKNLLIVDDIIDGGATFIGLANELKKLNPASINLYATHGIFSKGLSGLYKAGINRIVTTDSRSEAIKLSDRVVVLPLAGLEYITNFKLYI